MTIKESLKNGASKEALLKQLETEIEQAQKELADEEAKKQAAKLETAKIDDAREKVVKTMVDYIVALGIPRDEISKEEVQDLDNKFKAMEFELKFIKPFFKKENSDADAILKAFVKQI